MTMRWSGLLRRRRRRVSWCRTRRGSVEDTPAAVIEGYSTIFNEIDDAIDASGVDRPDVVVIPMGGARVHGRRGDPIPA
jgi:hypothetical protein